jgi:signal transduction histidine kinase
MDLRRVRLQLTALTLVLLVVAISVVSVLVVRAGRDRLDRQAEREAQVQLTQLFVDQQSGGEERPDNTWSVDVDKRTSQPIGETDIEPPLIEFAANAGDGPGYATFRTTSGSRWMVVAQRVNETTHVLAAVDIDDLDSDKSTLLRHVLLIALALVVAGALLSYWLAGRSLGPARRAMEQQRDFIADAAHELRTPLAVIRASASHTLSRPRDNAEYEQSLGEILAAAERAGVGVGELLELARLDAGQAKPRLAPLRLDLLVEEVAASIRVDSVSVQAREGEALVVEADFGLLHQVVETLTRNAAARASTVRLSTAPVGKEALIEVGDDGPGFDPAVLAHVFDRYRRGDRKGSTGLGMAIAKSIVEQHGGRIEAANAEGAQTGAVVRIWLPRT